MTSSSSCSAAADSELILNGMILENPSLNQGISFTKEQRSKFKLNGLLPYGYRDIDTQSRLIIQEFNKIGDDLAKYRYFMNIMEINVKLFYYTLINNLELLMPIVYTPVVGQACLEFSHVTNKFNKGIWITVHDIGNINNILSNWPNKNDIKGIVVTDGERILGLGDLGANGMGIPIGKIALYTAIGGIKPDNLLPIQLDIGTNNKKLLSDEFYHGIKKNRDTFKDEYDILLDEFMESVVNTFGKTTLVQFEDFGNKNAFRLLNKYKNKYCTFNDDIQGTAAVTMAGIYASLKGTREGTIHKLTDHTFLIYGAGSAGIGIANIIAEGIVKETNNKLTMQEAREYIWLMDSKGLIFAGRKSDGISSLKEPYAHDRKFKNNGENIKNIEDVIHEINATALIGVSGQAQTFTQNAVLATKKYAKYPLIFSLSNPTSMSECTAQQAYDWTNNELYFACGSPFKLNENTFDDNKLRVPSQGNNAYTFPGIALGIIASKALRVPNDIFLIAAQTVANLVNLDDLNYGIIYPPISKIREVSVEIGIAVAEEIYQRGLTEQSKPNNFRDLVTDIQYNHNEYRKLYSKL